jgi:flavodoxin short chain
MIKNKKRKRELLMKKIAVVYWSGTGNTEAMARAVTEGVKLAGAEAVLYTASEFSADLMDGFDGIAFGCPSMGAEVLEEDEFEPMFSSCESKLNGKKIALFGSYDWGDGEWMRNWEKDCKDKGALIVRPSVICNLEPDDEAVESCKTLGKELAAD